MPPSLRCASTLPSMCVKQLCKAGHSTRGFSSTSRQDQRTTRARRQLFQWLATRGENFRNPLSGSTNYMSAYNSSGQLKRVAELGEERQSQKKKDVESAGDSAKVVDSPDEKKELEVKGAIPPETTRDMAPFPLNRNFISQAVLGDELREEIWKRIMKEGKSVREVSAELGVEMSRVGAVVRLKEVEKEWQRIGKPLARPYHEAVMSMLPKTSYNPNNQIKPHESINDLPVHRSTGTQIFHPTSESRHFTRADAAKVFHDKLLPADLRVPHPELAEMHKDIKMGLSREEREKRQLERDAKAEQRRQRALEKKERQEAAVKRIDTGRCEYRFTEISVDTAGKDGRGLNGVGWRYGKPLMDRSRGAVKIPQSVE